MAHVRRDRADRPDTAGRSRERALKPRLALLTTGGTIASGAADRGATTGYTLKDGPPPEALLQAVPELAGVADITLEPFSRIASSDMAVSAVLDLAKRAAALLARDDVDGLVVTHGTDTLEETAWFLHLTVRSSKPIVLTGAMRPGTALGADGPMNLLAAVRVAACPDAARRGALVVLNDRIHSARLVRKAHTTAPDAFTGGEVGSTASGQVLFLSRVEGRHTAQSAFDAARLSELPPVLILPAYPDLPPAMLDAVRQCGAANGSRMGLVLACSGNGSLPTPLRSAVGAMMADGITVVRCSRTLGGAVNWAGLPGLVGGVHTPQKARILLALAHTVADQADAIQTMFHEY